jgi:sugar phosphate isomerase/epimerase
VHPRISVSAICSYKWSLEEDLKFYEQAGITNIGASVVKLQDAGWEEGTRRLLESGIRVSNLIGLGPFDLQDPTHWDEQRDRLWKALAAGSALGVDCIIFTTGPAGALPWEDAADALEAALTPVLADARERNIPFALEHTNNLRVDVGFLHSLHDAIDLARRLDTGVCMEINACWAERDLNGTITDGADRLALVQASDYKIGTTCTPDRLVPGDGDIPLRRILGQVLAAGYTGTFDLELIGPKIEEEGYAGAIRRSVDNLGEILTELGA